MSDRLLATNIADPVGLDLAEQRQEIEAKFFHSLSDLTRLRIVELLLDEGEKNVSERQGPVALIHPHRPTGNEYL